MKPHFIINQESWILVHKIYSVGTKINRVEQFLFLLWKYTLEFGISPPPVFSENLIPPSFVHSAQLYILMKLSTLTNIISVRKRIKRGREMRREPDESSCIRRDFEERLLDTSRKMNARASAISSDVGAARGAVH